MASLVILVAIGSAQASPAIDIDSHSKALSSTNRAVIRAALTALEKAGPVAEKAVPQIALLLGDTRYPPADYIGSGINPAIGERAARALSAIGKPSVGALTKTIETGNDIARLNAVAGLGQIADPSVAKGLLRALEDPQEKTRELSRLSLIQGQAEFSSPMFITACTNAAPFVRSTALLVLGRIRDTDATDTVLRSLGDTDANVRQSALTVLAFAREWIHDKRAFGPLVMALSDKSAAVRRGAAASLGQYKDALSVDPLGSLLSDGDISVRVSAAWSLGQIGGKDALAKLSAAMPQERNSYVRDQILLAIGEIGDASALPLILDVLKGDSSNRFNAGRAFEKITGKPFSEHPDWKKWILDKEVMSREQQGGGYSPPAARAAQPTP